MYVLDGKDGNAAGHGNWIADGSRPHLPKRIGKRRRKLFGPDPPEVAADRSRRCLGILARIAGERCAVLQLLQNLSGVGHGLRLRVGRRGEEDLADVIFLGALGRVQLVDHRLDLVVTHGDFDLRALQPLPRDLTLDLPAQRADR